MGEMGEIVTVRTKGNSAKTDRELFSELGKLYTDRTRNYLESGVEGMVKKKTEEEFEPDRKAMESELNSKTDRIHVRLTERDRKLLMDLCSRYGLTVSEVIRRMIQAVSN